jgi:hypothetical protein
METMGAPHSSTAAKHSSGVSCFLRMCGRILHLAAAGAGQVAAEERLKHQHQRIALVAGQLSFFFST